MTKSPHKLFCWVGQRYGHVLYKLQDMRIKVSYVSLVWMGKSIPRTECSIEVDQVFTKPSYMGGGNNFPVQTVNAEIIVPYAGKSVNYIH